MEIGKFNLIKTEGRARRGEFCTVKKEKPEYWNRRLSQQIREIEQIIKEMPE